mmetsp:Transcript_44802/g.106352  ORF Transcript_44802/g.106352 Transcript_44802/m.106352 type:complete len:243 (+) Transcript_44802:102-830(+)
MAEADESALKAKMRKVHWVPLESNPEMLTEFARRVGLPEGWEFVDVYGVDEGLLAMVPRPVVAVTLLFQCTEASSQHKKAQMERIKASGQTVNPSIKYLRQYVGNACGTIASIHSMANNADVLGVMPDTPLGRFLQQAEGKTPEESGALLAEATDLHRASESSAAGGQTAAPEATADVDHHFICFVEKGGDVYELDGAKQFPINHGSSGGDLLVAATQAIKANFMDVDPESISFNMMALVRA